MSILSNVETFFSNTTGELSKIVSAIEGYESSAAFNAIATELKTLLSAGAALAEAADPEVTAVLTAGQGLLGVVEEFAVAVNDAWKANF